MAFETFIALILGGIFGSLFTLNIYTLQIRDYLFKCRKEK